MVGLGPEQHPVVQAATLWVSIYSLKVHTAASGLGNLTASHQPACTCTECEFDATHRFVQNPIYCNFHRLAKKFLDEMQELQEG